MQLATFGQFTPALQRRLNTWYSANDGNWSDPNTWISNAVDKKNVVSPRTGDNVYILHKVNFDISATVNNLTIQGKLSSNVNGLTLTVNGDLQVIGTIDFTSNNTNVFLYGYNNFVSGTLTGGSSTFIYTRAGDQNVMPLSTYNNVTISTTLGTSYLAGNTTIQGNLTVNTKFECLAFNLTVNGICSTPGTLNQGTFSKNGSGNLLFIGQFNASNSTVNLTGNPNVEFRGGFTTGSLLGFISGTGTFTFTTNNQTFNLGPCNGGSFNAPILISGAITITNTTTNITFPLSGVINGNNASSTLNNNGILYLGISTVPMATGIFNYQNLTTSTIGYIFNGNYTLPYTSYASLVIQGTGIKTLSATTVLGKNLILNSAANFECSTFDLTVTGTTTVNNVNTGTFTKSGSGNILFIGQVISGSSAGQIDFSVGNPNVEFRGGISISSFFLWNTGTGTYKFSTNNQAINIVSINTGPWACNMLVSGAITVTCSAFNIGVNVPTTGVLNGDNASSTFINNAVLFIYNNATAPMATGKLYCNQATNTFIYGASGNQDITVPSDPIPGYKNLTLNGSGAKRLLGNVSVKGTYTLTGPATLNSNGFALTNP